MNQQETLVMLIDRFMSTWQQSKTYAGNAASLTYDDRFYVRIMPTTDRQMMTFLEMKITSAL